MTAPHQQPAFISRNTEAVLTMSGSYPLMQWLARRKFVDCIVAIRKSLAHLKRASGSISAQSQEGGGARMPGTQAQRATKLIAGASMGIVLTCSRSMPAMGSRAI